jgi:hypothetical protein
MDNLNMLLKMKEKINLDMMKRSKKKQHFIHS